MIVCGKYSSVEYIIEETAIENNGFLYKCVVSNSAGSVDSNAATLTVTEKTTVVSDYKIIEGQNCTWTEGSDGSLAIRGDGEFSEADIPQPLHHHHPRRTAHAHRAGEA